MNAMNAERTNMKELSKPTYRGGDKQNVETERDEQNKLMERGGTNEMN